MSLHLRLLVLRHETDLEHHIIYPIDQLEFDQEYDLFPQIQRHGRDATQDDPHTQAHECVKTMPLPKQLQISLAEYNSDKTRQDRYGDELTFTTAGELGVAALSHETTQINRAVMAYVRALPPKTPIVLYWH